MTWNHRIIQDDTGEYIIAECYYNDHGNLQCYTDCFLVGETLDELKELYGLMKGAFEKPVLSDKDFNK